MNKKFSDFTLRENPNNLQILGHDPNIPQEIRIPANELISSTDIISIHNSDNTAHSDIRTRLEECITPNDVNDIVENMDSILDRINNGESDWWKTHPDWWDIVQIFKEDTDPNKRFIMLVTDSNNSITLDRTTLGNSTAYFKTSDGQTYNGANIIHTWNRAQDRPCSAGYKTRYVIVYSNDNHVNCNISAINSKYVYFGNKCCIQYLKASDSTSNNVNRILESIQIDNTVTALPTAIGNEAFRACNSLISIAIPDGVTNIGIYAFNLCYSLSSITIPGSVTSIGNYAFYFCTSLVFITIPDSVTNMGSYVFGECFSLVSITIPNGVTNIKNDSFLECFSLVSITIPNSVTNIENYALGLSPSLSSITIPNSVTTMGIYAIQSCISSLSINIKDGWIAPAFNVDESPHLSISSMLDMFNKLGTAPTARTITLGALNLAKLTPTEKAIATNKGYTLA